jgi:hypothetical protein
LGAAACGAWVRQQEEALAEHDWVVGGQAQLQVEQLDLLKLEFCSDELAVWDHETEEGDVQGRVREPQLVWPSFPSACDCKQHNIIKIISV